MGLADVSGGFSREKRCICNLSPRPLHWMNRVVWCVSQFELHADHKLAILSNNIFQQHGVYQSAYPALSYPIDRKGNKKRGRRVFSQCPTSGGNLLYVLIYHKEKPHSWDPIQISHLALTVFMLLAVVVCMHNCIHNMYTVSW